MTGPAFALLLALGIPSLLLTLFVCGPDGFRSWESICDDGLFW